MLILNLAVFFIDLLLALNWSHPMTSPFAFSREWLFRGEVWRLITFQFLHANFGHLLFNMIALYFFGPFVEQFWRSRGFLVFYLVCGVAGALVYVSLELAGMFSNGVLVGASAGIFGILAVAALIAPNMQVRLLFPPITLTMKQLAIALLAFGAFMVITGGHNAGGEAGHLGGALAGFLLYKIPFFRIPLERLGTRAGGGRARRAGRDRRVRPAREVRKKRYERKLRPKSTVSRSDASEVDRILDKINSEGLQSLTEEERELLTRASGK